MNETNINKTYRRVPFDVELAKKIQSGEVEGRIVSKAYNNKIRIICFDAKTYTGDDELIVLIQFDEVKEVVGRYKRNGELVGKHNDYDDLCIEIPEEQPKHEFKSFEQVLVRNKVCRQYIWQAAFYSHFEKSDGEDFHVTTAGDYYLEGEIVPYAGNEHLVGTTNEPKED